ncbi:nucleotidyltransferase family protein [Corallococcus sp. AB049A]|uniref:Nucleotidyltransferase family protein n=1 Tax=Corallococcus interemptor TaxID=2316720 RepID=A0A3A8PUV7_9BACT|nr:MULTISPECIES: nucleotidyltransferase family protein [Corallococcus]RKH47369.1 nucleotidyltransferase family protein [Corallococcus sp. AB050B]RKH60236.1 nucleotidyltransferase family protein [Corallococcus interemptor]RKI52520.1 nucleotidyltransferase family protein [Corallococcus sp. AB049A]
MTTVAIVLLAAGGSSRLGQPKQLLRHEGTSLVRRAAERALAASPVVTVVLGAKRDEVGAELRGLAVRCVDNPGWALGQGSSLHAGLRVLPPDVDGALLMLCDQLRVDTDHLRSLIATFERTHAPIVASAYAGTRGVPALFSRALFPELAALEPTGGARGLIARDPSRVVEVPLPGGEEDVDTAEDVLRLTRPGRDG